MKTLNPSFSQRVVDWQRRAGRHDLPWQNTGNPYHVWLSEVMLQQTQVSTVLRYYTKFLSRFPSIEDLAAASLDDVFSAWSGLGYYRRARFLHEAAQEIMRVGCLPSTAKEWEYFPGIGRSTAAAIASFSYQERVAILDGNVKRVVSRFLGWSEVRKDKDWWAQVTEMLPENSQNMPSYTQGLMDLGAMICTHKKPQCHVCPLQEDCVAFRDNLIHEIPPKKQKIKIEKLSLHLAYCKRLTQYGEEVWLQQRPKDGIWGGLWSFPYFYEEDMLHSQFHCIENAPMFLISHRLTHRILSLHIWQTSVHALDDMDHFNGQWCRLSEALLLGLPKPIRDILEYASLKSTVGKIGHE